jgi:hypothetical protein
LILIDAGGSACPRIYWVRGIHQMDSRLDPSNHGKTARRKSWQMQKSPSQIIYLNNSLIIPQEENPTWRSILKQFFQDQLLRH